MPTKVDGYWSPGEQMITGKWADGRGYGLFLDTAGRVCLRINGQTLTATEPVRDRAWHFIAATFDAATRRAVLHHEPQIRYALDPSSDPVETVFADGIAHTAAPFTFAAHPSHAEPDATSLQPHGWVMTGHYNGKIDAVRLCSRPLDTARDRDHETGRRTGNGRAARGRSRTAALGAAMVAAWDFGLQIPTRTIVDCGPYRFDGELVGMPARGMTGHDWSGCEVSWSVDHREYGAIHFHDDDVDDARWDIDFTLTVPEDLPSAVYAIKLTTDDGDEDYVPFMVRPPVGEPRSQDRRDHVDHRLHGLRERASGQQLRQRGGVAVPDADHAAAEHVFVGAPRVRQLAVRHARRRLGCTHLLASSADPQRATQSTTRGSPRRRGSSMPICTSSTGSPNWGTSSTSSPTRTSATTDSSASRATTC